MSEPTVAVAGCGVVSAVGRGVPALREAIRSNRSGLKSVARFAHPRFQSSVLGAALQDDVAESDDPAWILAHDAVHQAWDEARPVLEHLPAHRIRLVMGTTKANVQALERWVEGRPCSDSARRHAQGDLLAADLAASLGLPGPADCISVACISGTLALRQGAKLIQRGLADAVMAVGVDHLSAFVVAGFTALKALDPGGCRPFDRDRCGLSPGESGAAIVLVRGDLAPAGAVVFRGGGSSNDANHMTGPSRDGSGLARAIRAALAAAGMSREEIDYVNVHGTGTPFNDAMESAALATIFGSTTPPVSGLKGMLGHTLGAAGVIESMACVLALQDQLLPGTPGLTNPAEGTPSGLLKTPGARRVKNILKLNTGFGGVNAALILSLP